MSRGAKAPKKGAENVQIHDVDSEMTEMGGEVQVDASVVACITVDVCRALGGDRALLDTNRVTSLFEVCKAVTVAADTTELGSSTSEVAAPEEEGG